MGGRGRHRLFLFRVLRAAFEQDLEWIQREEGGGVTFSRGCLTCFSFSENKRSDNFPEFDKLFVFFNFFTNFRFYVSFFSFCHFFFSSSCCAASFL